MVRDLILTRDNTNNNLEGSSGMIIKQTNFPGNPELQEYHQ